MKYLGSLTDVSQIPSAEHFLFNDDDVIYIKNDGRYIVYDDGEWVAYEGSEETMLMSLNSTLNVPISEQPDALKGTVNSVRDLPWFADAAAGDIYRVPEYNICFYRVEDPDLGPGWLLYVTNYFQGLTPSDVVDNCESEDTDKPLSAKQGKILYGMANGALKSTDVVDNLTSDDTGAPLSAAQGKALKGMIDGVETALAAI